MGEKPMSLVGHLEELRKRVMIIALVLVLGAIISYYYIDIIVHIINKPAKGLEFIYLSPPELFLAYIKISLVVGAVIGSPIILYQVWHFIKPGLKEKERKYLLFAMFMGIVFFLLGIVFAYFVIIPLTIEFFVKMSADQIEPLFSFTNYITFISSLLVSFGLVFELPLLMLLLTQLNLVQPSTFKHYRKYVILIIFVVAAILTPPDVVSQILMAIPMILLYEFSIFLTLIINKVRTKKD